MQLAEFSGPVELEQALRKPRQAWLLAGPLFFSLIPLTWRLPSPWNWLWCVVPVALSFFNNLEPLAFFWVNHNRSKHLPTKLGRHWLNSVQFRFGTRQCALPPRNLPSREPGQIVKDGCLPSCVPFTPPSWEHSLSSPSWLSISLCLSGTGHLLPALGTLAWDSLHLPLQTPQAQSSPLYGLAHINGNRGCKAEARAQPPNFGSVVPLIICSSLSGSQGSPFPVLPMLHLFFWYPKLSQTRASWLSFPFCPHSWTPAWTSLGT